MPLEVTSLILKILINIPQDYKDHAFSIWKERRKKRTNTHTLKTTKCTKPPPNSPFSFCLKVPGNLW